MQETSIRNDVLTLLALGTLFTPAQGLGQEVVVTGSVSGMATGIIQLEAMLEERDVRISFETIWSDGVISISPVSEDPSRRLEIQAEAIIGAIYISQSQDGWELDEGIYAINLRTEGGRWLMDFLNPSGESASQLEAQTVEFGGEPTPGTRVYALPSFLSPNTQPVLMWCWDNFCTSLSR